MKRNLLLFIGLFPLFYTTSYSQSQKAEVEYLFTIGKDLEFDNPGYLIGPHKITTDERGNIFVADYRSKSIKMYSPDGGFKKSFGMGGRGPGEFIEVSAISIDFEGNLLVLDRMSFKLVRFDVTDGSVEEHLFEDMNQINMQTLVSLPHNNFAGVYVESAIPLNIDESVKGIRVYEFGEGEYKSMHFEIYTYQFDKNILLEKNMASGLGYKFTSLSDRKLVVGHRTYKGKIFIVDVATDEVIVASNKSIPKPYYIQFDEDAFNIKSFDDIPNIGGLILSSGSLGKFKYQILYNSLLLEGSGERIFHIFERNEKEGKTLSKELEVYSDKGKLLLHESISEFFPEKENFRRSFLHLDDNMRLYVVNNYERKDPELKVYQLSLN